MAIEYGLHSNIYLLNKRCKYSQLLQVVQALRYFLADLEIPRGQVFPRGPLVQVAPLSPLLLEFLHHPAFQECQKHREGPEGQVHH